MEIIRSGSRPTRARRQFLHRNGLADHRGPGARLLKSNVVTFEPGAHRVAHPPDGSDALRHPWHRPHSGLGAQFRK